VGLIAQFSKAAQLFIMHPLLFQSHTLTNICKTFSFRLAIAIIIYHFCF